MKEEDFIRRLVQLAEGFRIIKASRYIIGDGYTQIDMVMKGSASWSIDEIKEWALYPLLLYRAKEGLNKQSNRRGIEDVSGNHWMIINLNDCKTLKAIKHSDYQPTEYLTQQEQALEEALKEVLK